MPVLATLVFALASRPCHAAGQEPARPPAAPAESDELAENEQLGVQLLNALRAKDAKLFAGLFDPDALVERAVAGLGLDSSFQKGWRRGAPAGLRVTWAASFSQLSDESKCSLAFVRVRGAPNARSLLFRQRARQGERFDYLEFWTRKGADGRLYVVDWVSHVDGQRRSDLLRLDLLTSTSELKRPDPEHLAGLDRLYLDHAELVRRLTASVKKSAWQETLDAFEQLPKDLRHEPSLQLAELRLAAWLGDVQRIRTCYEGLTAGRPEYLTADLWAFTHDLWGKDEARVLASLRRLQAAIGGDSQLDYIESNLLLGRGELEAANAPALRARASEPDWLDPYWMIVSIALQRHDAEAVLQGLLEIDAHFTLEWTDLGAQEVYKEFVASPQGAKWRQHLASK